MRTIKLLSTIVMIVIIIAVIFALPTKKEVPYKASIGIHQRMPNAVLQQRIQAINQLANKSLQSNISESDYNLKISELLKEIDSLRNQIKPGTSQNSESNDPFLVLKFWIKLGFSIVFCAVALFIILSEKAKEDNKKWAFGVLSLIAGIWIGTIS